MCVLSTYLALLHSPGSVDNGEYDGDHIVRMQVAVQRDDKRTQPYTGQGSQS